MIQELSVYEGAAGCLKAGLGTIKSPEVGLAQAICANAQPSAGLTPDDEQTGKLIQ
jgi:hypothetical protein